MKPNTHLTAIAGTLLLMAAPIQAHEHDTEPLIEKYRAHQQAIRETQRAAQRTARAQEVARILQEELAHKRALRRGKKEAAPRMNEP